MMERIGNGLRLVRASWDVVRVDREVLLLPVISGIASLAVLALLFFGVFGDQLDVIRDGGPLAMPSPFEWIILGIGTYALAYIAIFVFRVALYRYAVDGEAPSGFEAVDFAGVFPPKRRRRLLGS